MKLTWAALLPLLLLAGCSRPPSEPESEAAAAPGVEREAEDPMPVDTATPAAEPTATAAPGTVVTTPSGLKYEDVKVGTGASPSTGSQVTVHYTGTLEDGKKFDSSVDRGQPFTFTIGRGEVIPGWDEGVMSMKVGGKRKLTIPSDLGYGAAGSPPDIPGGATLLFDVELLDVK